MDARLVLLELGGVARFADLVRRVGRHAVEQAVASGLIERLRHGIYVLPELGEQQRVAYAISGHLSHLSAATHWGWSLKQAPRQVNVTVPRHRKVRQRPARTHIWYRDCSAHDLVDGVTEPLRTVIDCARDLELDEALCVADSALRSGDVTARELAQASDLLRGPGSRKARRVALLASDSSANPLESTLRAICAGIPGLNVLPQVLIREFEGNARVDLADESLRLVLEAEGYETHGTRRGFDADCRRYTVLAASGWLVLRFTWTQVMFEPDWVASRIREAIALQRLRVDRHNPARRRASL
ncbi:DUF559 domain-containing protein [Demetria terragena]|uniref:DUF559 domain-containing protein n=1 Tax=Demetria terragena TaxID=63959 RepID=UPI0003795D8B|nr:DUF559 domain-containing protein [Demetria terragena]